MHIKKSFLLVTLLIVLCMVVHCKNPFFPPTGIPRDISDDIIKKIIRSYENRRIDLFEDLLYSQDEFRFYIEQNLVLDSLQKINSQQRENVVITEELEENFIVNDYQYVYLTYSEEVNIHRNMFREADKIEFKSFESYNVQYFDTTVVSGDSLKLDTLEMVLYTDEASIIISSDKLAAIYGEKEHVFPIGRQVFFVRKNEDGEWKIRLWFERKHS